MVAGLTCEGRTWRDAGYHGIGTRRTVRKGREEAGGYDAKGVGRSRRR